MRQFQIFFTALMFFTRIPVPKNSNHSEDYLNSATKHLPLIGWLVGGISALVYFGSSYVLPQSISIILSMIASIIVTGAFHEDGFADVCDGFGGGWTKEKILTIMKDSRVGAFGVIGMIFMLLLKYTSLNEIHSSYIAPMIVSGHVFSRLMAVCFIFFYSYARDDASSKTKPLGKKLKTPEMLFAIITGLLPFLMLKQPLFLIIIIPVTITFVLFARYIVKWIGGFTGDCLGAMQQLTELVFYISAVGIISNVL